MFQISAIACLLVMFILFRIPSQNGSRMAPLVEKLPVPLVGLGEGPHWDSGRQTLYYVDIPGKTFHRYVPATKEHAQSKPLETTDTPNFVVPLVGHKDLFAAGIGHKVYVIRWDGQNTSVDLVQVIAELDMDNPKNAINDGKVGPDGRLYTGTIGFDDQPGKDSFSVIDCASFYSISEKGAVKKIDSGVKTSNGIAFDQKKNAVYHVDSFGDSIRRFDYDFATGKSSNKKNIFEYKAKNQNGAPDGMTIDTNGNLYVASFNGSNVLKINPDTGAVIETIEIPSKEVTSVTFGGPNLDTLFVTTGKMYDDMALLVEKLPVPLVGLGEGPHWDSGRQTLYYVDIPGKTFHRYVPATTEHAQSKPLETTDTPNFVVPLVGHKDLFAVGIGHKVYVIRWDGQNTSVDLVQVIAELDMENPKNAINDGKVGPDGRLYTGTIGFDDQPGKDSFSVIDCASFYSISEKGAVKKIDSGVKTSNGIAFDQKKNAVYHVDTFGDGIRRFDYDFATGKSSNKKNIFEYKAKNQNGAPDGMTIDTNGNLYVASFNGSNVLKINPDTGVVIETIEIPSKEVTSVTFGGPNLDTLFVTTGKMYDKDGGATYAVTGLGERGCENFAFNYKGLK